MSPEHATGQPLDARTDLYGLGCTMYRLLTDAFPFPGGTKAERLRKRIREPHVPIRKVRPELPSDLAAVVDRLLAPRPEGRYATAAEAADALESVISYGFRTPPGRGTEGRAGRNVEAAAGRATEPDLPPLDASVIEAALGPRKHLGSDPPPPQMLNEAPANTGPEDGSGRHGRATGPEGGRSDRVLYRQYRAELSQLEREAQTALEGGQVPAKAPFIRCWLERVGEGLGDFLSEPSAAKIIFLVMVIALALAIALGVALS
jgi:hypothetical protein